ncbi:alpha/beta fold hydrolase [Metapseudomonas otitidis]|jgi:pimeloyl-ACP methyl ester carboxylesterase|uniref:3-oxoadipate enol-lactonase n=1 Tax=Metapseudomonas otitidis TaxID=319939 RepID=A0A1I0TXB1_9GAMM|nr:MULTISPECIES: alpha/beta fold hydrolase [Pseudomonas]MDL5601101.1 alpha/beta fold hydrolase [Bacillus subtilis]KIV68380.1 Beta-ketoadipate enol-lactone hydrolase [Pseudomonas sp. FeS53a]MBO2928625.1 alpha/beta fold hydrolase [Pseudomonas otitidis]MCP1617334.1 pimeloyl-ACP methyl ester carboxylesterase [Pseudomonas otitidis]MDG9784054.1 alpha/beta hydrolase [Pseudomonas otitidis]
MIRLTAERTPAGTSYLATGQGQPVVLIHGVGLNKEMWGGQVVGLATQYRVIAYDMLGHGDSPRPEPGTELLGYADQLRELLDHLGLTQVTVIGFSMGGLVARAFALHYPQYLQGLVVLNSVFNRTPEQRAGVIARTAQAAQHGPDANAEAALSRWFSREYQAANPAQIAAIRQTLASNDPQGYLTTYELFATQDMYRADDLGNIRVPTLIATGELDPGSTPEMAEQLAQRIPGARAAVLAEQRHMMPVESPRLVNQLLLDFLATAQARPNPIKGIVA